jgi:BlaI family transcriptional regulator, penicillinase repressor
MKLADAEWKVMRVVFQKPGCTVREVLTELESETGWSYSTVKTLLARLEEKGAVKVDRSAASSRHQAALPELALRRSALRGFLERTFDGALGSLVHHLVADDELSPRELRELAEMLEAAARRRQEEERP